MIKIFIFDDSESRIVCLLKRWNGDEIKYATNYDDAIAILTKEPKFDLYLLDHDILIWDAIQHDFTIGKDGTDLVNFIVNTLPKEKRPSEIIVHSQNSDKGPEMTRSLLKAGISTGYFKFAYS